MRRKLELIFYAAIILSALLRYAGTPEGGQRRPPPDRQPAVLLPDGASLPRDVQNEVRVQVSERTSAGTGTGFLVDDKGTYVTARHVVSGCEDLFVVTGARSGVAAQTVETRRGADFALVRVPDLANRATARPFVIRRQPPARGTDGYMMGYPQGRPADVRATVIGATRMRSQGRYDTLEPVVAWVERERRPGFDGPLGGISGGPVFDGSGRVVGTVVAGAPRRGRVYTTHPRVFAQTGASTDGTATPLTKRDFHKAGADWRGQYRIVKLFCKA
ncbi:S1 family peptidase [Yunchengibacter salinarum]|uniref:S1 family peptidase n=1 Tax=Yunchengibacter salinarum TaxID=3133399 RepID=UPI0035B64087